MPSPKTLSVKSILETVQIKDSLLEINDEAAVRILNTKAGVKLLAAGVVRGSVNPRDLVNLGANNSGVIISVSEIKVGTDGTQYNVTVTVFEKCKVNPHCECWLYNLPHHAYVASKATPSTP